MLFAVLVVSVILIAGGVTYYRSFAVLPFITGVLLGAAVNAAKLLMLERAVRRAVNMDEQTAPGYVRHQYYIRYMLTGAGLLFAGFAPFIDLWGTVAGILAMQVAALCIKKTMNSG